MNTLHNLTRSSGMSALARVDFNVPLVHGRVIDDFRIRKAWPTIEYLTAGGMKVILIAHTEIETKGKMTLAPIADYLNATGRKVQFVENYRNARRVIEQAPQGSVILLENVRLHEGEKKNDSKFAQELASLADIYVNEAFSVSHRAHASVSAITQFLPSYAGFLFEHEVNNLKKAFNPEHPFLFILGGAKFETKIPLIEKFMDIADFVFIGGALANNFFKEQGRDIGISVVSPQNFNLKRFFDSPKLLLPIDTVEVNTKILDAGEKTLELLQEKINVAKYILWNGPLGLYEDGYTKPTLALARMIAQSKAHSIVGGGDTLATIAELKNEDQFSFVSTGGGAMLDFLVQGTLPGIEALEKAM